MNPKFNIDRPKISDEEIQQHKNFNELVERFKQQSIKQARGDESWWKNKKIRYTAVIAGVTVVCIITYASLFNTQKEKKQTNETLTTKNTNSKPQATAQKASAFIQAPSTKLKTPYSTYKINNAKGGEITHTSASKIKIPQNSFVDKNGKDIIGDVVIEYKEFHDNADVIANGIPMAYDSAGTKYTLETAGMFDIRGTQNGEAIFIKEGKQLEVQLASTRDEQKFNQYYLDTIDRNWKYIKKDLATVLHSQQKTNDPKKNVLTEKKLQVLKNEIEVVIPKKKDSVQVLYTQRINKLAKPNEPLKPLKSNPKKPSFKLDGSYDDFPELNSFKNVMFEVGPENRNYSQEFHEITWSDVKISQGPQKGKNYILTLSYRSRVEKLVVYPVFSGEEFEKAQNIYEQKFEQYQVQLEKRTQEEKRLLADLNAKQAAYVAEQKKKQEEYDREKAAMLAKYNVSEQKELQADFKNLSVTAKATRLFSISSFGIFNSDCPHPNPDAASVQPIFLLDKNDKFLNPEFVYLIDHNNKIVQSYNRQEGFTLKYDPRNTYSICVFAKNQMYHCTKADFKEIIESGGNKFVLNNLPSASDNLVDFKKTLEL